MKNIIIKIVSILFLTFIVGLFVFTIILFGLEYRNYEIQGEGFTIVCDEVKMNVNDNNYICSNNEYTYNFKYNNVLDLSKEYDIEIYYYKAHWIQWLGTDSHREYQGRRIVERID